MPQGELRRKDRKMPSAETEEILIRGLVGRIGTVGADGMPYVVPMNYVYDQARKLVFVHSATSGHLLENLVHSALACFEVDDAADVICSRERPCDSTQVYQSVICFGRARFVEERAEKQEALKLFVQKYVAPTTSVLVEDLPVPRIDSTTIIAIEIEKMTGKRRQPPYSDG